MTLTNEQKTVIEKLSNLDSHLVINAYAGTGKTTTLRAIAEAYPDKAFLYLAFNASVKGEAQKSFPNNVKVLTTHGLAYRWYTKHFGRPNLDFNLRPYHIHEEFGCEYSEAFLALSALHYFTNSRHIDIQQSVHHVMSVYKNQFKDASKAIVKNIADALYTQMKERRRGITHDFYLKLMSLSDDIEREFLIYDYILLDEAQDTNPVVYDILLKSNKPIIAVGDRFQKIYGFRNAMDVLTDLRMHHNADMLYLTHSFRFPQEIADFAVKIISKLDDSAPPLKGCGPKSLTETSEAVLCRTNAGIIQKAFDFIKHNKPFYSNKRPSEIFQMPFAILHVFFGYQPPFKIPNQVISFLRSFNSIFDLQTYGNEANDVEISNAIKLVNQYKYEDLVKLYETFKRSRKGVCITTAHVAKGLEFGKVSLMSDFSSTKFNDKTFAEEFHLFYVAATRAIHSLYIPGYIVEHYLCHNKECNEDMTFNYSAAVM